VTLKAVFTFAHSISTDAEAGALGTIENVIVSTAFPGCGTTSKRSRSSVCWYLKAPHCFAFLFTMNVHLSLPGIAKSA
jgi:hypothetical protein